MTELERVLQAWVDDFAGERHEEEGRVITLHRLYTPPMWEQKLWALRQVIELARLADGARHALDSYAHGNAAPDLAATYVARLRALLEAKPPP